MNLENLRLFVGRDSEDMPRIFLEDINTQKKEDITFAFINEYKIYNYSLFKYVEEKSGNTSDYLQNSDETFGLEYFVINTNTNKGKELLNLINQNKRQ